MSAYNWVICPQCTANEESTLVEKKKLVTESYGKVSQEKYLKLVQEAEQEILLSSTLREDWGIGTFVDDDSVNTLKKKKG